jgi:membrane protein required for colicin V production
VNWADWLIVGVIALSALMSLLRGFVVEVLSLVIWIGAGLIAVKFGDPVAALLGAQIDVPSVRLLIAYVGLFVLVLLIGGLVSWLVSLAVRKTGLSSTDRLLGMLFGALRGCVIVVLAVMVAGFTPLPKDPWWQASALLPAFSGGARLLAEQLPLLLRDNLQLPAALEPFLQAPAAPETPPDPPPDPPA